MPISTQIDLDNKIRIHTVSGDVTFGDVAEELQDIHETSDLPPGMCSLWDLRLSKGVFSPKDVNRLADLVALRWKDQAPRNVALVVKGDVDYGMARMYEQLLGLRSEINLKVFRDLQQATHWLKTSATETE